MSTTPTPPGDLASGGSAISRRAPLENSYRAIAEAEVQAYMEDMQRRALAAERGGNGLTLAIAFALWFGMIERVERRVPKTSQLIAQLRLSTLPADVFEAVSSELAWAASAGLSREKTTARLRVALGLDRDPEKGTGGEFGRILVERNAEGAPTSTRSWQGDSEAMARTASTADFADEMLQQLRDEGYPLKRWMTRYDKRVRDTHAAVDRVTIPLEESFTVGSTLLRYPADPMGGDIAETINCRCVLVGVRE